MARVEVYGASDDLIEVEGAIREEFNALGQAADGGEGGLLAFSDGTVLEVEYTSSGVWRISRIAAGGAVYQRTEATGPDGDYTDRVALVGDISWVVFGKRIARAPVSP